MLLLSMYVTAFVAPFGQHSGAPVLRTASAMCADGAPKPPSDGEPAPISVGKELQIDDDKAGLGVAALVGAAALVPLLALGVATTLGMSMGSPDNDGVGSPLSSQEVRATLQREQEARKDGNEVDQVDRPLTFEEAAEEQALVDVLRGSIIRAK